MAACARALTGSHAGCRSNRRRLRRIRSGSPQSHHEIPRAPRTRRASRCRASSARERFVERGCHAARPRCSPEKGFRPATWSTTSSAKSFASVARSLFAKASHPARNSAALGCCVIFVYLPQREAYDLVHLVASGDDTPERDSKHAATDSRKAGRSKHERPRRSLPTRAPNARFPGWPDPKRTLRMRRHYDSPLIVSTRPIVKRITFLHPCWCELPSCEVSTGRVPRPGG